MTRRSFIAAGIGGLLVPVWVKMVFGGAAKTGARIEKIQRTREEWKAVLTPQQFNVLREEGTEKPFSSPLLHIKEKGVYICAGCELPLFTSEMKFDSGTGWPSFTTSIPGRTETKTDYTLIWPRTEYHCARCGGHQGHVFKDGPPPTYRRWCNNGVALKFVPDGKTHP